MDALQDDDLAGFEGCRRGQVILRAGGKIKVRHEDFFPVQQSCQRIRQELDIQRVNGVKITRAIDLQGDIVPIDEEIVHRDPAAQMPVHLQVDPKPAGKGRLAAGRRPGHQHDMFVLLMDLLRDIVQRGFVQGLVHPDEMAQILFLDHTGQVAHIGDAQDLAPFRALGENLEILRPVDIRRGMVEVRPGRQLQHEAAPQFEHRENPDIAGRNRHRAVEIFPHAVDRIHIEVRHRAAAQQLDLILLPLVFEVLDRVLLCPAPLLEFQVQLRQAAHLILNADDILAVQLDIRQPDEHAVTHGVFDPYPLHGKEVPQGQQHHKAQGTLIDPAAFLVLQRQRNQGAVLHERVIQFPYHTAGLSRQRSARKSVQRFQTLLDGLALRKLFCIVHGTDDHNPTSLSVFFYQ